MNNNEWLRNASLNCEQKIKQSDLAPISQEAMNEKNIADGIAIRLSMGKWSEGERIEQDALRRKHLERYRELLNN